ncbi:MAG: YHS domain-containing protein [Parvularculaceae bacterium]|nr:YHS domain-containing protein [Parvularculaceae bacterium]
MKRMAAALACGVFFLGIPAYAESPEIYTGRFNNLAVGGYDAVAYFAEEAAVKGVKDYSYDFNGATWRFSSEENLEKFKADPESYAPQYGGYCAWAVSQGYTAPGNPENWSVRGDKLYLNYNDKVQSDWLKDPDGFIKKADANWPGVLSK